MVSANTIQNDTLTLALSGEVTLGDFAHAVQGLRSLIDAIQSERNPGKVEWIIDDLHVGSAIARVRGIGQGAETVVNEYQRIGKNLAIGKMPASELARKAIQSMLGTIGKSVTSVRFETRDDDSEIFSAIPENAIESSVDNISAVAASPSLGSVRGRIQSISSHRSLQFTVYDPNTDAGISCYLEPGNETVMRKMWGKLAIVTGIVRRNPRTGQPTTVRQISKDGIVAIPEMSGSWRDAIGASKSRKGEMSAEAAIRRGRDG